MIISFEFDKSLKGLSGKTVIESSPLILLSNDESSLTDLRSAAETSKIRPLSKDNRSDNETSPNKLIASSTVESSSESLDGLIASPDTST